MASTMKAVNYNGPFKVKVQEVDLPKIQHPDDVILKVTSVCQPLTNSARSCSRMYQQQLTSKAAICASDLQ
ncbi:uncharacterized protein G6M90_00g020380 [Metarhizium brunneum]|uniref:Uncharacterized protein n=1 Tax=Metarhizium brunneum TaxID=500148 RepID=A0A7D5UQK2_9HYPO|nr:hypothetical protein G6M90_00g020380 [Metarhizium brunneum]